MWPTTLNKANVHCKEGALAHLSCVHTPPPQDHCSVPNVRCTEDVLGRKTPFLCHIPYQVMELAGDLVD